MGAKERLAQMEALIEKRLSRGEVVNTPEQVRAQENARFADGNAVRWREPTGEWEPVRNRKLKYQTPYVPWQFRKKDKATQAPVTPLAANEVRHKKQRATGRQPAKSTASPPVESRLLATQPALSNEERLAEFLALVDCSPEDVQDAGSLRPLPPRKRPKPNDFGGQSMPWGKFRGRCVCDVPLAYLRTVATSSMGSDMAFKTELRQWLSRNDPKATGIPEQQSPPDVLTQEFRAIIGPPSQRSA